MGASVKKPSAAGETKVSNQEVDLKNFSLGEGSFSEKRMLLKSVVESVLRDDKLLKEQREITTRIKKQRTVR